MIRRRPPQQHALAVDVGDAQPRAVGHAQRSLVLEAGPGRGFVQAHHIGGRQHARQLPRIVRACHLLREVGSTARDGEATLWSRVDDVAPWVPNDIDGLDAEIEMPEIGCRLATADIYDGVTFEDATMPPPVRLTFSRDARHAKLRPCKFYS